MFSPLAYLPFYPLLSNLHMDESSCSWKYLHQLTFNTASCELFLDISSTEGCVRSLFTQQILMSLDQQEVTLKNATAFDNNSVIVIATNSLQACSYRGWEGLRLCKLFFFSLSRIQGIVMVPEVCIPPPNPSIFPSMITDTV